MHDEIEEILGDNRSMIFDLQQLFSDDDKE